MTTILFAIATGLLFWPTTYTIIFAIVFLGLAWGIGRWTN